MACLNRLSIEATYITKWTESFTSTFLGTFKMSWKGPRWFMFRGETRRIMRYCTVDDLAMQAS